MLYGTAAAAHVFGRVLGALHDMPTPLGRTSEGICER